MSLIAGSESTEPIFFEEFFDLGKEETASPFLKPSARKWGKDLHLKSAFLAAFFLIASFICSFFPSWIYISYFFLACVYFLAGIPSLIESLEELTSFEVNIDMLMTLAAFSSIVIGSGMEGGLLLVLFALSGAMEDYVTSKAKNSINSLHSLSPTKACVIDKQGMILERSVKDIAIGTHILIRANQLVPLDGTIIAGISSVNLVHLTGENLPITKRRGEEVPAGARNLEGTLTVEVTRTSADSTLARIIELVTQAQEERPLLQRRFDKLSKGYAIAIMGLAALFSFGMPFVLGIPFFGYEGSIYRSLAFLIAASPCALIIALPIAYLSAIGACARQGILLKGGLSLDALAQCTIIAFDKTGTLTKGLLKMVAVEPMSGSDPDRIEEAISIAYAMEKNALHPIAKALVEYGQEKNLPLVELKEFSSIPGYGLQAIALTSSGEHQAFIGHSDFILPKISISRQQELLNHIDTAKKRGELVAVLLIGSSPYLLCFLDTLRPEIKETIVSLKKAHLRLVMLTGDHKESARKIASDLGIDEYFSELRPEDKLQFISKTSMKEHLAMIGDGINDAPALARATVGICMGKVGSTAAIDAADIILLQDNIESLGWLIHKAHQTRKIVKQNLLLATLAILFASIPALWGIVPLWLAVVMHEGGTVLVGLNGLRLIKK